MKTKIRRGVQVLQDRGVRALASETRSYLSRLVNEAYWRFRSNQTVRVGDVTASFVAPDYSTAKQNRYRVESEAHVLADLLEEVEREDVFMDVGANTGLYSILVAKVANDGTVHAFEPYPPNVRLLKRNVEINECSNVEVHEVALSDTTGTVEFDQPESEQYGYGSASIDNSTASDSVTVQSDTGDRLVGGGELRVPNIVKIDVEGAEPLVIDGMDDTLSTPECRLVYCEIHTVENERRPSIREFGSSEEEIIGVFQSHGFEVERMHSRDKEMLIKCEKQSQ